MKTVTLKTDDIFFEKLTSLAKQLHLSKSELIRRSVKEYEIYMKKQELKKQITQASLNVRKANTKFIEELDANLIQDGLS